MRGLKALVAAAIVGMGIMAASVVTDEPEAEAQMCVASGYLVQTCGCWGAVQFGVSYPDSRCCSGWSTPLPCAGGCFGGGSPYRVMCD